MRAAEGEAQAASGARRRNANRTQEKDVASWPKQIEKAKARGLTDGGVSLDHEGYPVIDYDHCKGCLICQHVCPVDCIPNDPRHVESREQLEAKLRNMAPRVK